MRPSERRTTSRNMGRSAETVRPSTTRSALRWQQRTQAPLGPGRVELIGLFGLRTGLPALAFPLVQLAEPPVQRRVAGRELDRSIPLMLGLGDAIELVVELGELDVHG